MSQNPDQVNNSSDSQVNSQSQTQNNQKPKVAVLHAFFVPKGGGEKLIFDIRDYYQADLFTGAIDLEIWDKNKADTDSFVSRLYNSASNFEYLHVDSHLPIWRKLLRQWHFKFNSKIEKLLDYDVVIFSGNIGIVPQRLRNLAKQKQVKCPKLVMYCHTPPRPFTDQFESLIANKNFVFQWVAKKFQKIVLQQYSADTKAMDVVITNSENTRQRLLTFTNIDSVPIYPGVNANRFQFKSIGDYFLSYARIEKIKRIPLILDAFEKMPEQKLIMASVGPLADWVKQQIAERNLTNIIYEGLVTDERLFELAGNCRAGIYIPVDEDAGMTQCELMAAGKPVIGVAEGGLKETILDGKTGVLIPENPSVDDLINAVRAMNSSVAESMKNDSQKRGKEYDLSVFFEKLDRYVLTDATTNSQGSK